MGNNKAMEIFNELLEERYWAEDCVIHDRSIENEKDSKRLERKKKVYKEKFSKALEGKFAK